MNRSQGSQAPPVKAKDAEQRTLDLCPFAEPFTATGYYPKVGKRSVLGPNRMPLYFPMQNVEKIRLRISSEVVWPVRESSAQSAR